MTRNRFPIQLMAALMLTALALPYIRPATCRMMSHAMEMEHMPCHDTATTADHGGCDDCDDSMDCCAASLIAAPNEDKPLPDLSARTWPASTYAASLHTRLPHTTTPPPQL